MRVPISKFIQVTLLAGVTFVMSAIVPNPIAPNVRTVANARPWEDIVNSGILRVGVKDNLPPLAWQSGDDAGNPDAWEGFEIEIARELADRLLGDADAVAFVPLQNHDRLDAVIDDRVDLAIAQIGITVDRLRLVSMTEPYYLDGTTVVVPADSELESTLDLQEEAIAVLAGSTAVATLNARFQDLTLVSVSSYREGGGALQSERIDGFAADASVMAGWVAENPDYRLLTPLLSGSGLAIALPKGNQYSELRRQVHREMRELSESGWFEERAAEWRLP